MDLPQRNKAPQSGNFVCKHSLHLFARDNDVRCLLLNTHLHPALHILYHIPFFLSILQIRKLRLGEVT